MKFHLGVLVLGIAILSGCDRTGEEVRLQEGQNNEKQRARLIAVQSSRGAVAVSQTCTVDLAKSVAESGGDQPTMDEMIDECGVSTGAGRSARGSHNSNWDWTWGLYLGYFYPQNYQNYNYYGFGCNIFWGQYASYFGNTNCVSYYGGYDPRWYYSQNYTGNGCYQYAYNNNNYSGSNNYYQSYGYPSYCWYGTNL